MNHLPVSIVVATRNREELENACLLGADFIEIRLDLLTPPHLTPEMLDSKKLPPLIITLRSRSEGGGFSGTTEEWRKILDPWVERAVYIDVEAAYHRYVGDLRSQGRKVIASWHSPLMPTREELDNRERLLRSFGDIPKIVVTPVNAADLLALFSFTLQVEKPVCTGITGARFRYGRALLPLFGSSLVYCHVGNPTAEGQYHIQDFRTLLGKLLE
ncbi:MAG: type I 3-dehydroquinate dehydratase [Methanomicrobiales archaeon]|nr:type I 3-dehydroquinate dehydratase [Methanomicrobiales archaeon]